MILAGIFVCLRINLVSRFLQPSELSIWLKIFSALAGLSYLIYVSAVYSVIKTSHAILNIYNILNCCVKHFVINRIDKFCGLWFRSSNLIDLLGHDG